MFFDEPKREGMYQAIGTEVGHLVDQKNAAYGDSFGKSGDVLELLYPNGIMPEQYRDMLGIVRVIDKMFRIATDKDALGESPWRDIAGYGILGIGNAPRRHIRNDEFTSGELDK